MQCISQKDLARRTPKLSWVKYPFLPIIPNMTIAKKQIEQLAGASWTFELKGGVAGGRKIPEMHCG
jgi:O-acetylhomoserine/O-acetylserine sulfhydrylase-like pyridoxal-dependent enzyme